MTDILVTCALTLLAAAVAFYGFKRWQAGKNIWDLLSFIVAGMSALAFWLSWVNGFFLLVPSAGLLLVARLFTKK